MRKGKKAAAKDNDGGYIVPVGSPAPFKLVTTEELEKEIAARKAAESATEKKTA